MTTLQRFLHQSFKIGFGLPTHVLQTPIAISFRHHPRPQYRHTQETRSTFPTLKTPRRNLKHTQRYGKSQPGPSTPFQRRDKSVPVRQVAVHDIHNTRHALPHLFVMPGLFSVIFRLLFVKQCPVTHDQIDAQIEL